jgi:aminopeptidase YwaD
MPTKKPLLSLWILLLATLTGYGQSPLIHQIVQKVSGDTLFATIADLQPMDRVNASNSMVPADYLKQKLLDYGVDTVFYHLFKADTPPNVVGVKYGKQYPDEYYLLGGHYDAVLPGSGADDNASGTAAVVEMARVIQDVELKRSLILVLFSAEEVGLWGSFAFVDSATNHGVNIEGMINLDMIAYSHDLTDSSVSVCYRYFCLDMLDTFLTACSLYVPELYVDIDSTSAVMYASDHAPFWQKGIPGLFLIENSDRWGGSFNPYYHTFADTIGMGANSPWLVEKITRSAVATLLMFTEPSVPIGMEQPVNQNINITLYPNPTRDHFTISLSHPDRNINLTLYDNTGRALFTQRNLHSGHTVDISSLPRGVYFIRLDAHGENVTKKMVKY